MEALAPTITIRLPPELRVQLEHAAAKEDRPLSYIVRKALAEWLRRHGAPRDR
jgi:predicted transcriptional regulator